MTEEQKLMNIKVDLDMKYQNMKPSTIDILYELSKQLKDRNNISTTNQITAQLMAYVNANS